MPAPLFVCCTTGTHIITLCVLLVYNVSLTLSSRFPFMALQIQVHTPVSTILVDTVGLDCQW